MELPELQKKAFNLIDGIFPYDGEKPALKKILEDIDKEFSDAEKDVLMKTLLKTAVQIEYKRPVFELPYILKALAAGEIEITYNSMKASPWHSKDAKQPAIFDFSMLDGHRFTLNLIMKDVLTNKYGEEGRRLASSFAPMQTGLTPTKQIKHYLQWDDHNYALPNSDFLIVEEISKGPAAKVFSDIKVLEIGGAGKSYPEFLPFIKLLGGYKNVNDNSGGYTMGAIPASVASEGFVTHEKFRVHYEPDSYDYVLTSNVISHKAVGDEGMSLDEKFYYTASLFCATAAGLKIGGKMIHLNGYDKERVPALSDAKLHELCGVTPVETKTVTPHGRENVYVYVKTGTTKTEEFKEQHAANSRSWDLQPAFEFGKDGAVVTGFRRG